MNPVAHYDGTAEEILRDTGGKASFMIFWLNFMKVLCRRLFF